MSVIEIIVLALMVGAALFYLARRFWLSFGGRGGCCGSCPVGPKIRLAARPDDHSTARP